MKVTQVEASAYRTASDMGAVKLTMEETESANYGHRMTHLHGALMEKVTEIQRELDVQSSKWDVSDAQYKNGMNSISATDPGHTQWRWRNCMQRGATPHRSEVHPD